nr:hypothetical protein [Tepidibacillus decaturensis]
MKKLLLTGFEPFLDFPFNPSQVIANQLNGKTIGQYQVVGKILPVEFSRSAKVLLDYFYQEKPDVVISLGLAGGGIESRQSGLPSTVMMVREIIQE